MLLNSLLTSNTVDERTRAILQKEFANLGIMEIVHSIRSENESKAKSLEEEEANDDEDANEEEEENQKEQEQEQQDTLEIQMQIFENEMNNKFEDSIEKLNDPVQIINLLVLHASTSEVALASLINILQNLLIISKEDDEKK